MAPLADLHLDPPIDLLSHHVPAIAHLRDRFAADRDVALLLGGSLAHGSRASTPRSTTSQWSPPMSTSDVPRTAG